MTENEAIIQLNFDMEMIRFNPSTGESLTLEQIKAHNEDNYKTYLADELAITALLEVQQYRAIGTVEELKYAMLAKEELERRNKYLIPVKNKEREKLEQYEAIGTVEEIQQKLKNMRLVIDTDRDLLNRYIAIGTIDEFKALKEKATPMELAEHNFQDEVHHYLCPNCRNIVSYNQNYCEECGQALET